MRSIRCKRNGVRDPCIREDARIVDAARWDTRSRVDRGESLSVTINADGSYSVTHSGIPGVVMQSGVEADVNSKVLQSSAYPQHKTAQSEFHDELAQDLN